MSLSPQLNKFVRLIDQSLYEGRYLISKCEGRGGRGAGKARGWKCIDAGRMRGQKEREGLRAAEKKERD